MRATSVVGGRTRLWWNPGFWFGSTALAVLLLAPIWFWGAFSGGLDVAETCALQAGQEYDQDYRSAHWRETSRAFPLHNRCNADYDLVPAWVNPTLAVLAVVVAGSLVATVVTTTVHVRRALARRRGPSTVGT
ncbi:hypothetical protein ACIBL6_13270 [Streptomyces sp. NPDC050400]|uniref:hypothetical protein n=1 Tax=Streptomyces sp. NPDC050400 TaxID=3365610 RepID=UPI00379F36E7